MGARQLALTLSLSINSSHQRATCTLSSSCTLVACKHARRPLFAHTLPYSLGPPKQHTPPATTAGQPSKTRSAAHGIGCTAYQGKRTSPVRERIREKRRRTTSAHDRAARRASLSHRVPKGRSERGGRPRPQCRDLSHHLIRTGCGPKSCFKP